MTGASRTVPYPLDRLQGFEESTKGLEIEGAAGQAFEEGGSWIQ